MEFTIEFCMLWDKIADKVKSMLVYYLEESEFIKLITPCTNLEEIEFRAKNYICKIFYYFYIEIIKKKIIKLKFMIKFDLMEDV